MNLLSRKEKEHYDVLRQRRQKVERKKEEKKKKEIEERGVGEGKIIETEKEEATT